MTAVVDDLSPAEIRAAADAEIAEADARAAQLEKALDQGDPTVTIEHFEAAERQSRWARRRRVAAEKQAEARALELRKAQYERLVAELIPHATVDLAAQLTHLADQARAALDEALQLIEERNKAFLQVVRYASRDDTWKGDEDGAPALTGSFHQQAKMFAEFTFEDQWYRFMDFDSFLPQVFQPLKGRIATSSLKNVDWLRDVT